MDGPTAHNEDEAEGKSEAELLAEDERRDKLTTKVLNAVIPDSVENKQKVRRRIGRFIAYGLSFGILALAVYVLARTFMAIDPNALRNAIGATSSEQIALAGTFTALSFLALTGYDALALRQLRLDVPYPTAALASFTSYAISFTLGFPVITAGTVRYWIYSGRGLSAGKVASLTIIAGLTFWLGMALLLGIGFTVRAGGVGHIDHLSPTLNRVIGVAIIAALGGYLFWASKGRKAKIQGFTLELPGLWLTLGQIFLGLIDLCSASAVLFILMAPPREIDYLTFVTVYVFGSLLGIASNAPGGIGVFEATMLKTVPAHSAAALFAALLLFRIIYYLVPFVLALALLGTHEGVKRWKGAREATVNGDPESDAAG